MFIWRLNNFRQYDFLGEGLIEDSMINKQREKQCKLVKLKQIDTLGEKIWKFASKYLSGTQFDNTDTTVNNL